MLKTYISKEYSEETHGHCGASILYDLPLRFAVPSSGEHLDTCILSSQHTCTLEYFAHGPILLKANEEDLFTESKDSTESKDFIESKDSFTECT
jgi:hypothetical protein